MTVLVKGYDTKHGMHLVRLMRMCEETLLTGKVNVYRGDIDADELRAVRNGSWSFDRLIEFAHDQDVKCDEILKEKRSPLPRSPDRQTVQNVVMSMLQRTVNARGYPKLFPKETK